MKSKNLKIQYGEKRKKKKNKTRLYQTPFLRLTTSLITVFLTFFFFSSRNLFKEFSYASKNISEIPMSEKNQFGDEDLAMNDDEMNNSGDITEEMMGNSNEENENEEYNSVKNYTELSPDLRKKAERIFEVLRCPVCQNIPLKDSYTEISETMKKLIISKLKEGWTEEQIIDYFVQRYGQDILLNPQNNFYFLIPFATLLVGLGVLAFVLLKSKKKRSVKM